MPNPPSPQWLDAQYNNRALVPGYADILQSWTEASALARSESRVLLDVAYGSAPSEKLDVFLPAKPAQLTKPNAQAAPVLIFIHGGYWRALDKSDQSFVAPALNAEGAVVVLPNYALCPAVSIEHIALQMAAAVQFVWRNAADWGGDPQRIAVAGHSAGGHLASLLLSCRWKDIAADLPAQLLTGALSVSGVFDLEPLRHTPFLQGDLKLTPQSVARLSPAFFPRPKQAKLFAVVGMDESEEFRRQNRLIRDVWGPTAVPVNETVPGLNHFTVLRNLADPAGRIHALALRLLGLR
jgi:arylformamidase